MTTPSEEGARPSRDRLVLGAILALALCLRLYKLNAGLWYDEVDTLVSFTRPSFGWLLSHYPSLNHHVFFSLQAKTCIALFGESPFALRLPAALLGTGSVGVLWLLAREVSSRTVAHLSALLMAVAYHPVWFSQNGRGYTGLLFFGLLAVLFYVRGMSAESLQASRKNALWLAVSAALMLYTHLSAAFLLSTLGLVHVGRAVLGRRQGIPGDDARRRLAWSFRGLTLGSVLAVLLYLPIVPQLLASFSRTSASSTAGGVKAAAISHWNSPVWMLKEVARSFSGLGPLVLVAAAAVALVVASGMLHMAKRGRGTLPVLFLVHVPLTIALLKLGSMRIWPRYFFADVGFIVLFLVEGAVWLGGVLDRLGARLLGRRPPGGEHAGLAVGILGVLAASAMLPRNYRHPKQNLQGARDFVAEHRGPGSKVLALGLASLPFSQYYAPSWDKLDDLTELLALERANPELWVVYAFPAVTKGRFPAVMARLDYSFETAARLPGTMGDGDVVVLKSKYAKASVAVKQVAEGLSVLETRGLIGGNTGVYVQGGDALVVDSNAEPMAEKVERALREVTPLAPRWVINTHWHLDHAGGNAAFARRGAAILAHAQAARRLEEDLARREEPLESRLPTERLTDGRSLRVGDHEVRIVHFPAAHTDGDVIVHFVDANVIQTGDLFVQGSFPYISKGSGGTIDGYIGAQEKLLALCDANTKLIPGHGEVTGVDALKATLFMLKTARDRVADHRSRGQSLAEVVAADPLKDMQASWATGWITTAKMAEFVYTTLEAHEPARAERGGGNGTGNGE